MYESISRLAKTLFKDENFSGAVILVGHYKITGANDVSLDKNFLAKLNIQQNTNLILPMKDGEIYLNVDACEDFYENLSTAINKAKAFRNPGCADSLHFDGVIRFICIPTWDSMLDPKIKELPIRSISDLEKLYNYDPLYEYEQPIINKQPELLALGSSLMYCYNKTKGFFSDFYSEKTTVLNVSGHYRITGNSDKWSKHNKGFNAQLVLDHKLDLALKHGSSKDKDHLNNILSTVLFKVKSFRSKECSDKLQFSGKVTITADNDNSTRKTFEILDAYHFETFVDYMSHLSLPSIALTPELTQEQELKQSLIQPESLVLTKRSDDGVSTCYQRLKNICS